VQMQIVPGLDEGLLTMPIPPTPPHPTFSHQPALSPCPPVPPLPFPQIVPGLDEGLLTMSTGGVRRLYIPGELAFPKGLPAGGRPCW